MSTFTSIITYYWVRSPDNSEFGPWENSDVLSGMEYRKKLDDPEVIIHRGIRTILDAVAFYDYIKRYCKKFGVESWLNFLVSFDCGR